MSFKNKREIYQALVDGKKIKKEGWSNSYFIFLSKEGELIDEILNRIAFDFCIPSLWQEFKEPKKITLYRYTYKSAAGNIYQTDWRSKDFMITAILLKTESKEIEIEE